MKRKIKLVILSLMILMTYPSYAFDHSHKAWSELLNGSVTWENNASTVEYPYLQKESTKLASYLKELSEVQTQDFDTWTRNQRLAYLINAYNAFTVKLILDHYPVKSIKDIGSFFSSPWKKEFFHLLGEERSLDWIEHDKIRAEYNEPRIHFAVVCASIGCPGLRNEAFTNEKLEQQLEDSTTKFLNDTRRNYFDKTKKTLHLSSIFDWYSDDFVKSKGSVQEFVAPYMIKDSTIFKSNVKDIKIKHLTYNWELNNKK